MHVLGFKGWFVGPFEQMNTCRHSRVSLLIILRDVPARNVCYGIYMSSSWELALIIKCRCWLCVTNQYKGPNSSVRFCRYIMGGRNISSVNNLAVAQIANSVFLSCQRRQWLAGKACCSYKPRPARTTISEEWVTSCISSLRKIDSFILFQKIYSFSLFRESFDFSSFWKV